MRNLRSGPGTEVSLAAMGTTVNMQETQRGMKRSSGDMGGKKVSKKVEIKTAQIPPASAPTTHALQLHRRKLQVRQQPSSHPESEISPFKPEWARGELSWLVEFARRDEHANRVEQRMRKQDETWQIQTAEAAANKFATFVAPER